MIPFVYSMVSLWPLTRSGYASSSGRRARLHRSDDSY